MSVNNFRNLSEQARLLHQVCEILHIPPVVATTIEAGNQLLHNLMEHQPPAIQRQVSALYPVLGKRGHVEEAESTKRLKEDDSFLFIANGEEIVISPNVMQTLVLTSKYFERLCSFKGESKIEILTRPAEEFEFVIRCLLNPKTVANLEGAYKLFNLAELFEEDLGPIYTPFLLEYILSLNFKDLTEDEAEVLCQILQRLGHLDLKTSILKRLQPHHYNQFARVINDIPELNHALNREISEFIYKCSLSNNCQDLLTLTNLTKVDWGNLGVKNSSLSKLPATQITDLNIYNYALACSLSDFTGLERLNYGKYGQNEIEDADLRELAASCQKLRVLDLFNARISDEGLETLSLGCPDLVELNLSGTLTGVNGLTFLLKCTKLEKLILERTCVDESCLPIIAQWKELKHLKLKYFSASDQDLANCFSNLPKLEHLSITLINDSPIDECLASLATHCRKLRHLKFNHGRFSSKALSDNFPSLKSLTLDNVAHTEGGIRKIISHSPSLEKLKCTLSEKCDFSAVAPYSPELKYLELCGVKVVENDLRSLAERCPKLEYLNINYFDGKKPDPLPEFKFIQELDYKNSRLVACGPSIRILDLKFANEHNLSVLSQCVNLEKLSLTFTKIKNERFEMLVHCPKLHFLNLSDTTVSRKGLEIVARHCKNLKVLDLSGTKNKITDSAVKALSSFKLTNLDLSDCRMSSEGINSVISSIGSTLKTLYLQRTAVSNLSFLSFCPNLEELFLHHTKIKNDDLGFILSNCPLLDTLNLSGLGFITDEGIAQLLSNTPHYNLKHLNLGWTRLTEESFAALDRFLPGLVDINIEGIQGDFTLFKCIVSSYNG